MFGEPPFDGATGVVRSPGNTWDSTAARAAAACAALLPGAPIWPADPIEGPDPVGPITIASPGSSGLAGRAGSAETKAVSSRTAERTRDCETRMWDPVPEALGGAEADAPAARSRPRAPGELP